MPIISKETWDNLIPEEEKEKVRQDYQNIIEAQRKISFTNDEISGAKYQMELLFGKEQLQPQPLTYDDVARELYTANRMLTFGFIDMSNACGVVNGAMILNEKQRDKLLALNKLMNVAVYLNQNWKPDWSDSEEKKFFPSLINNEIRIGYVMRDNSSPVYFRTEDLANQAVKILGEKAIRTALSSDY